MWHYGLKHQKIQDFETIYDWYELAEIYGVGSEAGYTADPIQISGESIKEIKKQLKMILLDLEDPTIVEENYD